MDITPSYLEAADEAARKLVAAINLHLAKLNLPLYSEPKEMPDVYVDNAFGRSNLDHHSTKHFMQLANLAKEYGSAREHLSLLAHPHQTVYIPQDFSEPFETGFKEEIFGEAVEVWAGSIPKLFAELTELAPHLGVPLKNDFLSDEVAEKINEFELLSDDDDGKYVENERTAWLALYEGARLALEHKVALSLSG